jgi:membrane associated rhomboid family serine protease
MATRAKFWNSRQPALMTKILMAVNFAVFIWIAATDTGSVSGGSGISSQQCDIGLSKSVLQYGVRCSVDQSGQPHQWYRLVTSGFLHFGIIHIAFNMFALYQLGQLLERRLGRVQFTMLYFAALLGGSLGVLILDNHALSGGASGAVFGLMTAAAIGLHHQGINVFSTGLGTVLLLNFFITFTISGISIGGHIGGAVAGAVCGYILLAPKWKQFPKWAAYATPAAVAVISVVASVVISG